MASQNVNYDKISEDIRNTESKHAQMRKQMEDTRITEMVAIGNQIWEEIKEHNIPITNFKECDELYRELCDKYEGFAKALPVILQYMVNLREYSSRALTKYLKKFHHDMKSFKSIDDAIEAQADYIVLLYKETHTHYTVQQINSLRRNCREQLKKENERRNKIVEEAKREAERLDKENNERRRKELYELLVKIKLEREQAKGYDQSQYGLDQSVEQ
jgi:hypothetical protein